MAKEFSRAFYNSATWHDCRETYLKKHKYICEKCGGVAVMVHHKITLTPDLMDDIEVLTAEKNLMALCNRCHAKIHSSRKDLRYYVDMETGEVYIKDDVEY